MILDKKVKSIIGATLIVGSVGVGALKIFQYNENKNCAINIVKLQTSNINKEINFDKAYSHYLQHLSYTYYKDHNNNEFVCVSGKLTLKGRRDVEDCKITYTVDREHNTLKFYDMTVGNMHCNEIDALILKIKAYGNYDSKSV